MPLLWLQDSTNEIAGAISFQKYERRSLIERQKNCGRLSRPNKLSAMLALHLPDWKCDEFNFIDINIFCHIISHNCFD